MFLFYEMQKYLNKGKKNEAVKLKAIEVIARFFVVLYIYIYYFYFFIFSIDP